jgi:mannose-1-phosphate guanylyltransferase
VIGSWVRINGLTVTGEDVKIKDESYLNATIVLPHKDVAGTYSNAGTIII